MKSNLHSTNAGFYCSAYVHFTQVSILRDWCVACPYTLYCSGSQTFSDRVPSVGPILLPRTTLSQENSIYQMSFNQKFWKQKLTPIQHEQNRVEKIIIAIFKTQLGKYTTLQAFINRNRQVKIIVVNIFLWRKTESRPIHVTPWRP